MVGDWLPADTDVADVPMVMSVDGAVVETGSSAAILDDPIRSLVAAARLRGCAAAGRDGSDAAARLDGDAGRRHGRRRYGGGAHGVSGRWPSGPGGLLH